MDEDAYDLEDDFIDDGDVHAYFDRDEASTKHKGFFINAGGLERDSSQRSGGSSLRSPGSAAGVSPSIQKKMRAGGYKNLSAHQKALVKKLAGPKDGKVGKAKKVKGKVRHDRQEPHVMSEELLAVIDALRQAAAKCDLRENAVRKRVPAELEPLLTRVAEIAYGECPNGSTQREVVDALMEFMEPFTADLGLKKRLNAAEKEYEVVAKKRAVAKLNSQYDDSMAELQHLIQAKLQQTPPKPPPPSGSDESAFKSAPPLFKWDHKMEDLLKTAHTAVLTRQNPIKESKNFYAKIIGWFPSGQMTIKDLQKALRRSKLRGGEYKTYDRRPKSADQTPGKPKGKARAEAGARKDKQPPAAPKPAPPVETASAPPSRPVAGAGPAPPQRPVPGGAPPGASSAAAAGAPAVADVAGTVVKLD